MLMVSVAANAHDSSVAVATEDEVLVVLEAERITRKKKQWSNAAGLQSLIERALADIGRSPAEVTHWSGSAMGNMLLPRDVRRTDWTTLTNARLFGRGVAFLAVNHHLAHAASSFFASPFDSAIVDACDGGGDGRQHVAYRAGRGPGGASLTEIRDIDTGRFSGVFYDVCSFFIYGMYCQEGKFMGLAAHGQLEEESMKWLDQHAEALSVQPHEVSFEQLHARFGIDRFDITDPRCANFARNAQEVFESQRVRQLQALAGDGQNVVLSGGSALNIHANTAIRQQLPHSDVYVPPCCDDTGQALGALLYQANVELGVSPRVRLPFTGLGRRQPPEALTDHQAEQLVADLLDGKVVAWHWGRAEIGPRALGHRSLLCAPLTVDHRVLVSERVKQREAYRPVAPIMLARRRQDWFEGDWLSPYMLFADHARPVTRTKAPAVVHVDGSARIQTIDEEHVLARPLRLFEQATGVPMLINTSLNGPGEPIVQSAEQALAFGRARPDVLVYLEGRRQ